MEAAARFPLRQPGSELLLGSLLVRDGLVEMEQVEEALADQETGSRLCVEGVSSLDEIRRVTGDRIR